MMELMNPEVQKKLPPLGTTSEKSIDEMTCSVKLFTPDSSWTWYLLEYDPVDRIAFGFVDGDYPEFGLVSITELEMVRGPLGLPIERDLYFPETPMREIVEKAKQKMFI